MTRLPVINHPAPYSDVRDGREMVASVSGETSKGSFTAAFGVVLEMRKIFK